MKKVQYNKETESATVTDATLLDIAVTAVSTTDVLVGGAGLAQRIGLFAGGMVLNNYLTTGQIMPSFRRVV